MQKLHTHSGTRSPQTFIKALKFIQKTWPKTFHEEKRLWVVLALFILRFVSYLMNKSWHSPGVQTFFLTMAKKNFAQLFDDYCFIHRGLNYKKSVSILKSLKKSINWVVSEYCSSKTSEIMMIWSKDVNFAYCQKERFWTVPFTSIYT